MMDAVFRWFYCLDIPDALLLILICTGMFLRVRLQFEGSRFWKPGLVVLVFGWATVVALQTVLGRTTGAHREMALMPFQSYLDVWNGGNVEIYRSNLMNVLLFYPAGLLTACLWTGSKRRIGVIVLAFTVFSAGIEFVQYYFGLGVAQTDDVIHNSLGVLLGVMACILYERNTATK